MPAKQAGKMGEDQGESSATHALRDGFANGVIIFDGGTGAVTLTGEAGKILALGARHKLPLARDYLPRELQKIASQVAALGEATALRAVPMIIEGRGRVFLDVTAVPVPSGKRNATLVLCLSEFGTGKALDQHLVRLHRLSAIGTFSATMAHEIKNALVASKTFIELLIEKQPDSELAAVVRRETSRIDSMVSRLLKFAGPDRPAFTPVRLHEVLEHSLRLVEPQLQDKSIALSRSFQAAPDVIKADGYELEQAFVNLFLNALEAMGQNGALTVATQATSAGRQQTGTPPHVVVTIRDTGPGIPPEAMERLFEPFFTTKPGGTGLGLAITQQIIQQHHGTIQAESGPNRGAVFSIILPTSPAAV